MTGLEKISEKILSDSKIKCENILEEASLKAKEILTCAKIEADKISENIIRDAEDKAKKINLIAKSNAESITRNRYLDIRNAILNDIISAAYERIEKFSDEEYFSLIKKLCNKHFQSGECVMFLNSSDLYRLPDNFENEINSEIFEKGAVHVSKEAIDVENGFILRYEGFEVNCTFRAIFDESMDDLKFELSKVLFE